MHDLDLIDTQPFVLVADDEPDAVRLVSFHLRRQGYRVGHAADGLEALNGVFEGHPDLLVLDLMLPKLDGLEVCRMLRTSPGVRGTPVLMLTARASLEDKLRGFGVGADDYLTKPYELTELLARVEALLARGRRPRPIVGG